MLNMLTSVLRLDKDNFTQRIALHKFGVQDNFYEFQTHVFLDAAFEGRLKQLLIYF